MEDKSPSSSETFSSSLQILTRVSEKKKKKQERKKKKKNNVLSFNSRFTSGETEIEALVIVVVATNTYYTYILCSLHFFLNQWKRVSLGNRTNNKFEQLKRKCNDKRLRNKYEAS